MYEFADDTYFYNIDNEQFYLKIKDSLYKKMHICIDKNNSKVVAMKSVENRKVGLYVEVFKAQNDL